MQILLPPEIVERLVTALDKAGDREIGGILMGEHIAENVFRVKDLTIQRHSGSFATFLRLVQGFLKPLRRFFHTTDNNYIRFNYLGEWHSHPSFVLMPSNKDCETMRDIVDDPDVGANFVVLMIVKLSESRRLDGTMTIYQPGGREFRGQLVQESKDDTLAR